MDLLHGCAVEDEAADGVRERQELHDGDAEADLRLHLNLVDALELVLDRILDGEKLLLRRVEAHQARVERRRLAAAGRAGDEQDALGVLEDLEERRQRMLEEAQRREIV